MTKEASPLAIIHDLALELAVSLENYEHDPRRWYPEAVAALTAAASVLATPPPTPVRYVLARAKAAELYGDILSAAEAAAITNSPAETLLDQARAGAIAAAVNIDGLWFFDRQKLEAGGEPEADAE